MKSIRIGSWTYSCPESVELYLYFGLRHTIQFPITLHFYNFFKDSEFYGESIIPYWTLEITIPFIITFEISRFKLSSNAGIYRF